MAISSHSLPLVPVPYLEAVLRRHLLIALGVNTVFPTDDLHPITKKINATGLG